MSRTLSTAFKTFLHGRAPGDGEVLLLRIAHADFTTQRYASPSGEDVVSGAVTYSARGFTVPLPRDEDGPTQVNLSIDATDMDDDLLLDIIGAADDEPTVEVDVVLASDPDTVEATFNFLCRGGSLDGQTLSLALDFEPALGKPYPGVTFEAATHTDLY